jgi:hypothetical protein
MSEFYGTPLHSSDQLREDLLPAAVRPSAGCFPSRGAIILSLYILSRCAHRDLAPSWHSPLFDLAGYAVLITRAVYPWLDARGTARSSAARQSTRFGTSFHGPASDSP